MAKEPLVISFVLPTNGRADSLARTLRDLGSLDREAFERVGGGEVIVVDNGGDAKVPSALANGFPVRPIRPGENLGTAARNLGAYEAEGEWIVMLDDDSAPRGAGLVDVVADAPDDVAAIGAEIFLPTVRHREGPLAGRAVREAGGLPEVFVGCGVLLRREVFLGIGGYDRTFGYYVEEYDLCARLLLKGWRVTHDRRFVVDHRKVEAGRDMNRIVRHLVRNGGWVAARYAPDARRDAAVKRVVDRCRWIAEREDSEAGFGRGLAELQRTIGDQPRTPMSDGLDDRFTGLAAVRQAVKLHQSHGSIENQARIVHPGKHVWCVERALHEAGVEILDEAGGDMGVPGVVGTLSPGPMWDAMALAEASGAIACAPWVGAHANAHFSEHLGT